MRVEISGNLSASGTLTGRASVLDPFSGGQVNYAPSVENPGDSVLGKSYFPPQLPGIDPNTGYQRARGGTDGPFYTTPNILASDPPWLRLAYMRYPIDRESLLAFVLTALPAQASSPGWTEVTLSADQDRWIAEKWLVEALRGSAPEKDALEAFRKEHLDHTQNEGAKNKSWNLIETWAAYQKLAMCVLWTWGTRPPSLSYDYYALLTWDVAILHLETHRPLLLPLASFRTPQGTIDLEEDRRQYLKQKDPESRWKMLEKPLMLARLFQGFYDVVGTAGAILEQCPNCGRIFWRPDTKKHFCSPYCRRQMHRKKVAAMG